jgi:hypothetical protein
MIARIPMAISFWIQDIFPGREYGWSYVGFPYGAQRLISESLDPSPSVMNGGESIWRLSVCYFLIGKELFSKLQHLARYFPTNMPWPMTVITTGVFHSL